MGQRDKSLQAVQVLPRPVFGVPSMSGGLLFVYERKNAVVPYVVVVVDVEGGTAVEVTGMAGFVKAADAEWWMNVMQGVAPDLTEGMLQLTKAADAVSVDVAERTRFRRWAGGPLPLFTADELEAITQRLDNMARIVREAVAELEEIERN